MRGDEGEWLLKGGGGQARTATTQETQKARKGSRKVQGPTRADAGNWGTSQACSSCLFRQSLLFLQAVVEV